MNSLDETPLTIQQRLKRGRIMRRLQPRIRRAREIKKRRFADTPTLMKRTRKAAIKMLRKKFAGKMGADYANLSASQKITVDRLIEKRMPLINRYVQRLLPKIRKAEMDRLKSLRSHQNEEILNEGKVTTVDDNGIINVKYDGKQIGNVMSPLRKGGNWKAYSIHYKTKNTSPKNKKLAIDWVVEYHKTFEGIKEEHGAGEWGTDELRKTYAKDTPGQDEDINLAFDYVAKPDIKTPKDFDFTSIMRKSFGPGLSKINK